MCRYEAPTGWFGQRCPSCGRLFDCQRVGQLLESKLKTLAELGQKKTTYYPTGNETFDFVVGGGLVKGSTILFGGSRGAGKSSLLIDVANGMAKGDRKVLYASGEESAEDVGKIAHRLGVLNENIEVMGNANDIDDIIARAEELKPFLIIIDSLQVMTVSDVKGTEGSVSQGVAVANVITSHCKRTKQCGIVVNHMAKSGEFVGSSSVEHLVDTVLTLSQYFIDDDDDLDQFPKRLRYSEHLRLLSVDKNRNGEEMRSGFFEMTDHGVVPVKKRSKLELVKDEE